MDLAAGLLGLGALGIFSGLCWLIHTADSGERRTTRFYLSITYVIALIVSYHVTVTARDYLDGFGSVPRWLDGFVRVEQWTLVALVVAVAAWRRFRRSAVGVSHRYVIGTAYGYVGCVVVAAYMAGRSSAVSESAWQHIGAGTLAWTAIVGVTLPAGAVLAQLLALPVGRPEPTPSG
jgi:hypothetical protein